MMQAMAITPPTRLRIAPPDIRTADSTVADQIYAGYFTFAGKTVHTRGGSPFHATAPSEAWRRSLTGFSWLRHLRAAETALAQANARALVADFIAIEKFERGDPAIEPVVTARRLSSFLTQAPTLLENAEPEFYDAFMASLAQSARILWRALASDAVQGADRIRCGVALLEYAICSDSGRKFAVPATRALTLEIERQILPDGGHVSRNAQIALDILLDLLPLRLLIAARGLQPPAALLSAIDRIMPHLRMLQHGDGSLALFNGVGATAFDRLASALAFEDTRGAAPTNAPYSGYQRLEIGDALLIVDAGAPPEPEDSRRAHAGCLSFEFSLAQQRIVTNCGAPAAGHDDALELARATAAHSTLVLGDRSSARIAPPNGWRAGQIVGGPDRVDVERSNLDGRTKIVMRHDGYARDYGLVHERMLTITHDRALFAGHDRLMAAAARGRLRADEAAIRFHLHPRVIAAPCGSAVELTLDNGERLIFESDAPISLDASIFLAAAGGARRCAQIVLSLPPMDGAQAHWSFRRIGAAPVPPAAKV